MSDIHEIRWQKAQAFAAEFRNLVRRYVPERKSDDYRHLLPWLNDSANCYSPAVWDDSSKPAAETEIMFVVSHAGEKASGLRGFTDVIRVRCESNQFGGELGELGEFAQFMAGALSEWYDGAHVHAAEVRQSTTEEILKTMLAKMIAKHSLDKALKGETFSVDEWIKSITENNGGASV